MASGKGGSLRPLQRSSRSSAVSPDALDALICIGNATESVAFRRNVVRSRSDLVPINCYGVTEKIVEGDVGRLNMRNDLSGGLGYEQQEKNTNECDARFTDCKKSKWQLCTLESHD